MRTNSADFAGTIRGYEKKQWMTKREATKFKTLKLYKRGNRPLYVLHELDKMRKHRRLIEIRPAPYSLKMSMYIPGTQQEWRYLKNKAVLLRFPAGTDFTPTESNCELTIHVAFHEPSLGLRHTPVIPVLRDLAERATEIIRLFN